MRNGDIGRAARVVLGLGTLLGRALAEDPAGFERHAMEHAGDAARGREVFNAAGSLCATCHSVDGTASRVGPDLGTIGSKFGRRDLIRSVLDPGASIAVGYGTLSITRPFSPSSPEVTIAPRWYWSTPGGSRWSRGSVAKPGSAPCSISAAG